MNVSIAIHPYRVPLICPLVLGGQEIWERTGWLVELTGPNGQKGWGEIAPLPGVSSDAEIEAMEAWDGERVDSAVITPSVRCGMDMAFFSLGDPDLLPQPLRGLNPKYKSMPVNALLIGEIDDMLKQGRAAAREGYRTIKIKVGRADPGDEVKLLHAINRHSSDEVAFRLDVNRAWTPDDADRYLSVLTEMNVEYVEEPFADARTSLAWSQGTGVPIALDESLRRIPPDDLHSFAGLRAVVLKPSLIGGFVRCVEFAEAARAIGAYPVIGAMLETGVGTINMARLAAALCDEDTAIGLDTYRWLAQDVLSPRPTFREGRIDAETWDWSRYNVLAE